MVKELCYDTEILSTRCERATADDAALADDLVETLRATEEAGCLAANQIGVTKCVVAYLDDDGEAHVLYNPRLLMGLRAQKLIETCMTLEEDSKVTRYMKAKVSYEELVDGKLVAKKRDFMGWEAQMVQHLIDHCNGKLV